MKIGVTERGDAGLDFSWVDKLFQANIIISKNLNNKLIDNLIKYKDKIIFHMTCTGYGRTILEPNVPSLTFTCEQIEKLIKKGFPARQIVLRIDPIISTNKGIFRVEIILNVFKNIGIKRVRFSFLDLYPNVQRRFLSKGIKPPYNSFTAPLHMREETLNMLDKWKDVYELESCAEDTPYQLGCISQKDIDILGIDKKLEIGGYQRKGCLCAQGKTELLNNKFRCPHQCLYCYWKDK